MDRKKLHILKWNGHFYVRIVILIMAFFSLVFSILGFAQSNFSLMTSTYDFSKGIRNNVNIDNDEIKINLEYEDYRFFQNTAGSVGSWSTDAYEMYQYFKATKTGYIKEVEVRLINISWWVDWTARIRVYATDRSTVLAEATTGTIPRNSAGWYRVYFSGAGARVEKDKWYWIGVNGRDIYWSFTHNMVEGEILVWVGWPINQYQWHYGDDAHLYIDGKADIYRSGNFISAPILSERIAAWNKIEFNDYKPPGTFISYFTQTSDNQVDWEPEVPIAPDGTIQSAVKRYIKWKSYLSTSDPLVTPVIYDVTVKWFADTIPPITTLDVGLPRYPTDGNTYVASFTPFTLTAIDSGVIPSKVIHTYCQIDTDPWETYTNVLTQDTFVNSFTFSSKGVITDGLHAIDYYSVDQVGNIEAILKKINSTKVDWEKGTFEQTDVVDDDVKLEEAIATFEDFEDVSDWSVSQGTFDCVSSPKVEGNYAGRTSYNCITSKSPGSKVPIYMKWYMQTSNTYDGLRVDIGGIVFVAFREYNLYLYNGSWVIIQRYSANTWYCIELKNINWATHTFDIWVDGVEKLTGQNFLDINATVWTSAIVRGYTSSPYYSYIDIWTYKEENYKTSGAHTSQIIDFGSALPQTGTFRVSESEPDPDHYINYEERHGNPDKPWSSYKPISDGGKLPPGYQCFQIKSKFFGDGTSTPILHSYSLLVTKDITVVADITPPTGSILIDAGAVFTDTTFISLRLTAGDTGCGLSHMGISNFPDFSIAETVTLDTASIDTTYLWTLTETEGVKTVYVRCFDNVDNTSTYSDTIILDMTPPTGSILINTGDMYAETVAVVLNLNAVDAHSNIDTVVISNFADFSVSEIIFFSSSTINTAVPWVLLPPEAAAKTIYVKYYDEVGNVSEVYSDTIFLVGIYQLTTEGGYSGIQWAPDGERFAAKYGNNEIAIFKLNDDKVSATKKGTISDPDFSGEFAWSPDGTKIAYQLIEYLNQEEGITGWTMMMAEINNEGEVIQQNIPITSHGGGGHDIIWSLDGTKLAFATETAVYTVDVLTKQSLLIIEGEHLLDLAWMPDGNHISYIRFPVDIGEGGFLARVNIASGIEERLSSDNKIMESIWGFPKQGKNKVYLYQLGGGRIWMNEDGTEKFEGRLLENEQLSSWAPDGRRFIYTYDEYGDDEETILNIEIGIMNSDGTGKELLTSTKGFNEGGAKWSPKDNLIIYTEEFSGNIYLMKIFP